MNMSRMQPWKVGVGTWQSAVGQPGWKWHTMPPLVLLYTCLNTEERNTVLCTSPTFTMTISNYCFRSLSQQKHFFVTKTFGQYCILLYCMLNCVIVCVNVCKQTYLQSRSCLLIPAVPTVRSWTTARCPRSKWPADSSCRSSRSATVRRPLCDLRRNISHLQTV